MGIFYKFLYFFLVSASLVMMSSCGKNDSGDEPIPADNIQAADFVGAWKLIDPEPQYLIINSDGTGSVIEQDDVFDEVFEEEFDWVYMNQYLIFRHSEGRINMLVSKITKNSMVLVDDDKEVFSYARIKITDIPNHENDSDDDTDYDDSNSTISTLSAEPHAFRATLSGQYSGNKTPETVGFQYSYDSSFPEGKTATVTATGKFGGFEIEARGMVDLAKVYYRAFAIVDENTIYGKTKSFTTTQGTYTIDGKKYNFIKVTGLPTGSFSMMQTELPPSAIVEVDGEKVGIWNSNTADPVTKGETREFFNNFGKVAVIPRYPTAQEWLYAAAGGSESNGFKYSGSNDINEVAWYLDNSNSHVRNPALKKANELGFYDMSGNYAELCSNYDEYELEDIREKYIKTFTGPISGSSAAYFNTCWYARGGAFGGSWASSASQCQANSSEIYKTPEETNRFDSSKYTVRIAYSRPD